jgi:hypothetical protein
MSHWSFAASKTVWLLGGMVWIAAGWICWNIWNRSGRRKAVAWLEVLRFALVTLLGFTLLRPEFVRQLRRTERPEVLVLADMSSSMKTRDILSSNGVVSRAEWIAAQKEQRVWKSAEASARVIVEDFAAPPERARALTNRVVEGTDLNQAMESALQRRPNLKALLLLTDGDWNQGRPPTGAATRYRERDIPVFTVAVGRETPLPDLILENVSAPSFGLLGEQISIPFRVRNNLKREVRTTISLLDGNREEARKEIVLPPLSELQEGVLWSPRTAGDTTLSMKLPVEADEGLPDNNEQSFRVSVRVEKLKVLVVDSLPRWEYRYLRNALARDPGVEMQSILFHPGMAVGGGRGYLSAFPGTKEAISRYDVIFLGDVGIGENELTEKDAELLKGLVEQQSSGLVFLPGRRGRELTLLNSALRDLIPVQLDQSKPEGNGLQNEAALLPTTVGRRHWMTRFDSDENKNEELWKQLPGFYWSAAVEKSRPGSEVIAVHSSQRNSWGRIPLLVSRPAGSGKVLFMGTDSAWRWRRGVEDRYHYRFWSQVVRWMAHQRHLSQKEGIRLAFSPETPSVGDTVFLQATVLDASGFPVEEGPLEGRITSPSGRAERLQFTMLEGGWGVFKAGFTPPEGGDFKVELDAPKHGRKLDSILAVTQPVLEKPGQPVNSEILREISSITRGATAGIDGLAEVVQKISLLPEPRPVERRTRLWSDPWWGGAILVLLALYWTGRKLAGLV